MYVQTQTKPIFVLQGWLINGIALIKLFRKLQKYSLTRLTLEDLKMNIDSSALAYVLEQLTSYLFPRIFTHQLKYTHLNAHSTYFRQYFPSIHIKRHLRVL